MSILVKELVEKPVVSAPEAIENNVTSAGATLPDALKIQVRRRRALRLS